jgi:hypothetical protein
MINVRGMLSVAKAHVTVCCSVWLPADPITSQNNPIIQQKAILNYYALPIAGMKEVHASALNVSVEDTTKPINTTNQST